MTQYAASNKLTVDKAIAIATKKRQLILLMIDDYTTIHTNEDPLACKPAMPIPCVQSLLRSSQTLKPFA
jgi:hypothetical protein